MSFEQTKPRRRKLPSRVLSWVGEEGVTVTDAKIKPDLNRFAKLPREVLAQLREVENDTTIIHGLKFTDIPATDNNDVGHDNKTTRKGKNISIQLKKDTFRRIAGIREYADIENSYLIRRVEIRKNPEKSLGFYICEGDGWDRQDGIFVSRLVLGSYIEANGFLRVGDEIIKVNEVNVTNFPLDDVALMMQVVEKLVLTVKVLTSVSLMRRYSTRLPISLSTEALPSEEQLPFVDISPTYDLVETKTTDATDPQIVENIKQSPTDVNKSPKVLSISQVLDEGYEMLDFEDTSAMTVVDIHNSTTQNGNKPTSQAYGSGVDTSPTAIVVELSERISSLDQNAHHTFPDSNEVDSDGSDSANGEDTTDFSLFKRKKAKKKIPLTSGIASYEVKKSLWQMQEESMLERIDPIRDMVDTSTTFTGKESNVLPISNENLAGTNDSSVDSFDGSRVMIKIKSLSNISSFTPQNIFCCIMVDDIKKESTKVKSIRGTSIDIDEQFYIDLLSRSSGLKFAICTPVEGNTEERIVSFRTVMLPQPDSNNKPEEISLEIDPTGILTIEIQVLPLEAVFK